MKRFFLWLLDTLYGVLDYIIMIAIVLVLGVVISWRLGKLFNTDIINNSVISTAESTKDDLLGLFNTKDDEPEEEPKLEVKPAEVEVPTNGLETATPVVGPEEQKIVAFTITETATLDDVANTLMELNLIKHIPTFKELLSELGVSEDVKPGEYRVPSNIKNMDLIETITLTGGNETPAEGEAPTETVNP